MNVVRSHGSDFSLLDFRHFFASVLRISAALSRLPTTSAAQQRLFLANAAFTLAAPNNGLPDFSAPSNLTDSSSSSTELLERKPADHDEPAKTPVSNESISPADPNETEELPAGSLPNATSPRNDGVGRGPLTLTEVTTKLWRAGRADAVLKLLLKYEREFGTAAMADFLRQTHDEVVEVGKEKGMSDDEAEVDWKEVAKAIRGFGYAEIAMIVETAKASDSTQRDEKTPEDG